MADALEGWRLQYQLSNGAWMDCEERAEEFLQWCEEHNGMDDAGRIVPRFRASRGLTRTEVLDALRAGTILRNDSADWYSTCRAVPHDEHDARSDATERVQRVHCACGHDVPRALVMHGSRGTCCPDCYDEMSD